MYVLYADGEILKVSQTTLIKEQFANNESYVIIYSTSYNSNPSIKGDFFFFFLEIVLVALFHEIAP